MIYVGHKVVGPVAGPQAAALVEAAGLPPEQTLSQLWAEGGHELPTGQHSLIRLLGVQSLLVGVQRMASVLLLCTTPSFILRLDQVRAPVYHCHSILQLMTWTSRGICWERLLPTHAEE